MTKTTISAHARAAQDILNKANELLETTRELARNVGLAPFRVAHISKALADNQHAWQELNDLAAALELTTGHIHKANLPPPSPHPD